MVYFFLWFSVFISLVFCFFCFLEWDAFKSCAFLSLGVLFMSMYVSLGNHVWYSYFMVLIFLSGVLSLLVYLSSLGSYVVVNNYYFWLLFFFFLIFVLVFCDFGNFCFFVSDCNFLVMYYSLNVVYVVWIVLMLILLLSFISLNVSMDCCLRSL
uniref:NADH dehydrogenase subunit 6 n=1 Tax=Mastophorus muris TaxID=1499391 RepID=UPI002E79FAC8|nr:NADH dehydrogenase subunit 6 [Mastophorus muris]WPN85865.1 NADH dehydrogenase subunit 6 [Mastophorus muris]